MKILRYVCTKLVIVAIAWSFAAAASIQARQPRSSSGSTGSDNAYLIVNRAANFGTRESINLSIDGVQVAVIGLTQGLTRLTQRTLDAQPGKTYAFTALWDDSYNASLENHAPLWQKVL